MRITVVGGGYVGSGHGGLLRRTRAHRDIVEIDAGEGGGDQRGRARSTSGARCAPRAACRQAALRGDGLRPVAEADHSFVCVGNPTGGADLSMVVAASRSIGEALCSGNGSHTVVVKSTVPPGTTAGLVVPATRSGLR